MSTGLANNLDQRAASGRHSPDISTQQRPFTPNAAPSYTPLESNFSQNRIPYKPVTYERISGANETAPPNRLGYSPSNIVVTNNQGGAPLNIPSSTLKDNNFMTQQRPGSSNGRDALFSSDNGFQSKYVRESTRDDAQNNQETGTKHSPNKPPRQENYSRHDSANQVQDKQHYGSYQNYSGFGENELSNKPPLTYGKTNAEIGTHYSYEPLSKNQEVVAGSIDARNPGEYRLGSGLDNTEDFKLQAPTGMGLDSSSLTPTSSFLATKEFPPQSFNHQQQSSYQREARQSFSSDQQLQ